MGGKLKYDVTSALRALPVLVLLCSNASQHQALSFHVLVPTCLCKVSLSVSRSFRWGFLRGSHVGLCLNPGLAEISMVVLLKPARPHALCPAPLLGPMADDGAGAGPGVTAQTLLSPTSATCCQGVGKLGCLSPSVLQSFQ